MKIGIDREQVIRFEEMMRHAILSGNILPGEKLMSPEQMSKRFHIGRLEVLAALRILRKDKLIISFRGKGTYVLGVKPAITLKKTICVVTAGPATGKDQKVIREMERVLALNGYDVIVRSSRNSQAQEKKILNSMMDGNAAGYIIEPSRSQLLCDHMDVYQELDEANKPYLFIRGIYPQMTDRPRIVVDDSQGGYLLTRHMIAAVGENVVGIFRADDNRGSERHRGYVKALQEAGIPYRPELVIWYHLEERMQKPTLALEQILTDYACDGVICYDDAMATNILYFLLSKGYSIPKDIAIAGYGNTAVAMAGELGLTTIAQPEELLGEMAAEYLLEMIHGEAEVGQPMTKILSPQLVIRGSTVGSGI